MKGHRFVTIDRMPRPLHPVEAKFIAVATCAGVYVRACTCGDIIYANNDIDAYCRWKEHVAAAKAAR